MGNWKENKVIGTVAAIVFILVVIFIFKMVLVRNTLTAQQKQEIERINAMVEKQMRSETAQPAVK